MFIIAICQQANTVVAKCICNRKEACEKGKQYESVKKGVSKCIKIHSFALQFNPIKTHSYLISIFDIKEKDEVILKALFRWPQGGDEELRNSLHTLVMRKDDQAHGLY